jgi:hypothetical protein
MNNLTEIKRQFDMVKHQETFVITSATVEWLINEVDKLRNEKEEYRLEVCRLYDLYCQPKLNN